MHANRTTSKTESGQGAVGFILILAAIAAIVILFTSFSHGWPWWDWRITSPSQAQMSGCFFDPTLETSTAWWHKPLNCADYRAKLNGTAPSAPTYPESVIVACVTSNQDGLVTEITVDGVKYICSDVPGYDTPGTEAPGTDEPGTPAANDEPGTPDTIFLLGGRWFDFISKGYETVTAADQTWVENGAPMQPYTSQVTTKASKIPEGLDIPEKFEIINDSLQAVVVYEDNQWVAYVMPRDYADKAGDGLVNFNEISWVQYTGSSVKVCRDDVGGPGQWSGICSGDTVTITEKVSLEALLSLKDFAHYADPLDSAMERDYAFPDENKAVLIEVFVKNSK